MWAVRGFVATIMLATSFLVCAADIYKTFSPYPGAVAEIGIDGGNLFWSFSERSETRRGEVNFDTNKPLNLEIGSYDFSGRLGFLVSYMDDGMGVYEIYRIFTFSPSSNEFVERFPSCGDEFINLTVDRKSHSLLSTYWDRNIPKRCITRLPVER